MFKERYKIEMTKRIETRFEVQTFIDQLKYALVVQKATLKFQRNRRVDDNRHIKYTNAYTVETLFPDDDILNTLKKELLTLKVTNYIQTVRDYRYPNLNEMRVFGKCYGNEEVYIKLRVELLSMSRARFDCHILNKYVKFLEDGDRKPLYDLRPANLLDGSGEELFDLLNDPLEQKNLAYNIDYESVVKAHRELLLKHLVETNDNFAYEKPIVGAKWRSHELGYHNHKGPTAMAFLMQQQAVDIKDR